MKKAFVFILLFFNSLYFLGQDVDTIYTNLKVKLENAKNNQLRVNLYFELSDHQLTRDFNESIDYLQKAEDLINSGGVSNKEFNLAELYSRLGVVSRRKGDYKEAISYYLQAQRLYEDLKDTLNIGSIVHNMGVVYRYQNDNKRAIKNFKEAVRLHEIVKDTSGVAAAYNMMGVSYRRMSQLDSALICYDKAMDLFSSIASDEDMRRVNNNLATLYAVQKRYDKSIPLRLNSLNYYKKQGNKLSTAVAYASLSKDFSGLDDHKKAMKYADSSLAISLKEGYKERLSRIYLRKSIINRATKDFESAYNNYRKYKAYADSVHDINDIKKIQELELKYEFEKEKEQLEVISQQKEKEFKFYIFIFIILIAGGGYMGYLLYRNYTARVRIVKEKLEKEKLKKELLREKVKVSESELKSLVADNSMRLKFIQEFSDRIKGDRRETDSKDIQQYTQTLLLSLQQQIATESKLSSIQDRVEEVNRGFDQKIMGLYPNLTKTEREVCALLRLNLSIKEIASIRNATIDAVKASRYRIRKKLQVPSGVELEKFIQSL